jgi:hypothetical protein
MDDKSSADRGGMELGISPLAALFDAAIALFWSHSNERGADDLSVKEPIKFSTTLRRGVMASRDQDQHRHPPPD